MNYTIKRWEKKEQVRNLRSQGLSYKEIRERIPFTISKSTISDWCKDILLTSAHKERISGLFRDGSYAGRLLGSKVNQSRREAEIKEIKGRAIAEWPDLSYNEFKVAGLMLYWAEGNKKRSVGVSNSDPELVRFMIRWFRQVCRVDNHRIKLYLNLHSGQDEIQVKDFWSKVTSLPLAQFGKSYIKKEGTGHRKNRLYNGTIKIQICDKNLLYRILGWIEGLTLREGPLAQSVAAPDS